MNGITPRRDDGVRIVLGGRFGEEPPELSHAKLNRFFQRGGTVIETGHSYADGHAERVLGKWIAKSKCRDEIVVIDKVCHPHANGLPRVRPNIIRDELSLSLRRLGTDHVDVLLLHRDDPAVPVNELLEALTLEVASARIRSFGVANWSASRLREFIELAHSAGHQPIVSYQYSLAVPKQPIWPDTRHVEPEIESVIHEHDVPLIAWAAQARGWFADATVGSGPFDSERNRHARQRCEMLANQRGIPATTIALAWSLHQPIVASVTVGPASITEVDDSLDATQVALTDEELRCLASG